MTAPGDVSSQPFARSYLQIEAELNPMNLIDAYGSPFVGLLDLNQLVFLSNKYGMKRGFLFVPPFFLLLFLLIRSKESEVDAVRCWDLLRTSEQGILMGKSVDRFQIIFLSLSLSLFLSFFPLFNIFFLSYSVPARNIR